MNLGVILDFGVFEEFFGVSFFAPFCPRFSDTRSAGEDAGSARRAADGVPGEDFWKKPRIDFWLFMFCVLDVVFFSAAEGGVAAAVGEDAGGSSFAIVANKNPINDKSVLSK